MSATDPPPPDSPTGDLVGPDAPAPPPNKGGRPGVERATVIDAIDTWIARTGRHPSQRELRAALGDTGSLGTLGRLLREHRADQLLAGATPDRGSPDAVVTTALNAAMGVLAAEAADAAEAVVVEGSRAADARVAAADGLRHRAETAAATSDLERERALGRVEVLEERARELRDDRDAAREALDASHAREGTLTDTVEALRVLARERELAAEALERDRKAMGRRADTAVEALERERAARAAADVDAARREVERDAARERTAVAERARDTALAETAAANARARDAATEAASARERSAALEQARVDADAARTRAETALAALRGSETPGVARLLSIIESGEFRLEQERDGPPTDEEDR